MGFAHISAICSADIILASCMITALSASNDIENEPTPSTSLKPPVIRASATHIHSLIENASTRLYEPSIAEVQAPHVIPSTATVVVAMCGVVALERLRRPEDSELFWPMSSSSKRPCSSSGTRFGDIIFFVWFLWYWLVRKASVFLVNTLL